MKQGKLYKLGDICDFQGVSQPPKQEWIRTPKEGYVRMLQIRDFTQSREFIIEYVKCSKKLRYCNEDDILIGRYGASVGKILTGLSGAYNVAIIKTIPNEQIITKAYIRRFFEGDVFQALLQKVCGQRTAQAGFSKEDIVDCPIFVPPLSEQLHIVALLDAEFAKIDALKANAEKNLQNAKDLFQAALKKELEPKEGWVAKRIEEIADIKGGKRVPKGYKLMTEPTSHPYIRVADFNDNASVSLDDIHYIEDWVYKEIKRYTISTNDVYISIAGTIGKSGIIPKELEGANLTENACKLVLNQGLYNRYVYYCTINESFKAQIAKLTMQAAQPKLALTRLASATISIPSLKDQQSIVARLDALNEKCKTLQANYEKTLSLCDDLKQALLRREFKI